jgi:hypothetical protein
MMSWSGLSSSGTRSAATGQDIGSSILDESRRKEHARVQAAQYITYKNERQTFDGCLFLNAHDVLARDHFFTAIDHKLQKARQIFSHYGRIVI